MAALHGCLWLHSASLAAAQSGNAGQRALVYARDPAQTPQPELADLPLAVEGEHLHHPWLSAHSCVDLGASVVQAGRRVRVCTILQSATADPQGRFAAAPAAADAPANAPDPFAEQMLFLHGARTLRFFAELGLEPPRTSAPLQLIANVRLPATDALLPWRDGTFLRADEDAGVFAALRPARAASVFFGQDHDLRVAYDSAAIRHEVSHAALAAWLPRASWIVDVQGTNSAPAAIAEALADYFAAAIADDPRLGVHAGHGAEQPLTRNLNTTLTCPADLSGAPHQDGLMIASALWEARKQLGGALDEALARALKKLRAPATTEQLLRSVLDALGPRQPAAARIFKARGLVPSCQRVLELTPRQSFSSAAGRLMVPGATPALAVTSSILQLRTAVPADVTQLELRMRAAPPPFDPVLLVSPAPIRWTPAGAHNGTLISAADSGTTSELRFLVPNVKAQTLYLQVVNRGQRPGWLDAVRVIHRR